MRLNVNMDDVKKILKSLVKGQESLVKGQESLVKGQESLTQRVGENEKMIRALINGQTAMKQELLTEINKVDKKVDSLKNNMREGFKKVNDRLDKQGKSLAYLEDDTPTIGEFEKLEKRVTKLETQAMKI
jgi:uncharacterized phage infection (PIP) family protein YhgE